jgi:hypothetical protein
MINYKHIDNLRATLFFKKKKLVALLDLLAKRKRKIWTKISNNLPPIFNTCKRTHIKLGYRSKYVADNSNLIWTRTSQMDPLGDPNPKKFVRTWWALRIWSQG